MEDFFFIVSKKKLLEALLKGAKIINTKSLSMVTIGFLFEINNNKLTIHSTDLGNFLLQTVELDNDTNAQVEFIVDLVIFELIKKISDEKLKILINFKNSLQIKVIDERGGEYILPVKKAKFPKKEINNKTLITTLNLKRFQQILKSIMIQLNEDSDNFSIIFEDNLITFKVFNVIRCSYIEIKDKCNLKITKHLNIKLLEDLFKIFEYKDYSDKFINIFSLNEDTIFEAENIHLVCVKGNGGYYNHLSFLSSNLYNFKINLKDFKQAIDTQLVLSEKRPLQMSLVFKTNMVEISSYDINSGRRSKLSLNGFGPIEEQTGLEIEIPPKNIYLNALYLSEALNCNNKEENVLIKFSNSDIFNKFLLILDGIHIIPLNSNRVKNPIS